MPELGDLAFGQRLGSTSSGVRRWATKGGLRSRRCREDRVRSGNAVSDRAIAPFNTAISVRSDYLGNTLPHAPGGSPLESGSDSPSRFDLLAAVARDLRNAAGSR